MRHRAMNADQGSLNMDKILTWLNPVRIFDWASASPWIMTAFGLALLALVVWQIRKGSIATRRTIVNVVGIGLVIWGGLWFSNWVRPSLTADQMFTSPLIGPQPVTVVFATRKTIEKTVTYTGSVHPFERIVVDARTSGFVKTVSVSPGDQIRTGETIARLETSELQPRLDHEKALLTFLRVELKRDQQLSRQGAIPASRLDLTRSKELAAVANQKLLQTQIGYATIKARSDGWVSNRFVDPGQYVQKGKPIISYVRLSKVRIRFNIAEQDLASTKIGSEVILEFPQIPRSRFKGTKWQSRLLKGYKNPAILTQVTAIFPSLDKRSRLGVVEVLLNNPNMILHSNGYVIGHLITARVQNAWVVPERALTQMPQGKTVIFTGPTFTDQGAVVMHEVKVGLRNGTEAQILKGLKKNAYVVVTGNRELTDGENVLVLKRTGGLM